MKRPREAEAPETDGLTLLHRSRLVPWSVAAVTCLAACPDGSVFAAGYDDGKVEVFDGGLFNCLARIPGSEGAEVSSLAWARATGDPHWRLFAATLDGRLLELSCQQLRPVAATDSYGGAVWCLRTAPAAPAGAGGGGGLVSEQLAAACGDGSVRLFGVAPLSPGAQYQRSLPRVEGNVLALAWHPAGHSLVSGGSDGCLHVWDPVQGTELQRVTVGISSASPPCVWSLAVLADGTVVSGDSEGAVQFWDGRFGTLLSRHQQLAADVLALAASPDGRSVWASGVDPRVVLFHLVPDKASSAPHWVYLDRKAPHTHDVRALGLLERPGAAPLLVSGGNDGQLVLYPADRFLKEHPTRQSKTPQAPLLQLCAPGGGARAGALLHAQGRVITVWELGRAAARQPLAEGDVAVPPHEGDPWDLAALPSQLAALTTASSHHIAAAALAPDASAVAAADRDKLRLFMLRRTDAAGGEGEGEGAGSGVQRPLLRASRVKVQQEQLGGAVVCCAFSSDARHLFAATGTGHVVAVDAASGEVTASVQLAAGDGSAQQPQQQQQQPQPQQAGWCSALAPYMPAAAHIAVAPSGHVLAVATAGGVELLAAPQLQRRGRVRLVGEPAPVTSLAFTANSKFVAVGTASNAVGAYSAETGMPTQWTLKHHGGVAELLQQLPGSISGLSFRPTPAEPLSLLVHSPGGLCHLDMSAALPAHAAPEKAPRSRHNPALPSRADPSSELGRNGRLLKLQHSCLLMGHLSANEALLLEKPWQDVLQQLLPPLYRHRYGT